MITYTIVGIVVLGLLILGTTQRKQLAMLFKSEMNNVVEKRLDNIKVAKVKIKELKANIVKLINQAGTLLGEEKRQEERLIKLETDLSETLKSARAAKDNNHVELAKEKLKLKHEITKQIKLVKIQIVALQKKRNQLEIIIQRSKGKIAEFEIKSKGLESRQAVNNLLKSTVTTDFLGDNVTDNLENADDSITIEEVKLEYVLDDSIDEEDFSEEIERDFKEL